MEQPNWDRIQEIYHAALALPRSDRRAFIARVCEHDPVVAREVYALLDADDSSSGFLESPVVELGPKSLSGSDQASSANNLVGTTVGGRYLIERKLGHGGMGQVYFALDLRLNRREVVIKTLSQALLEDSYARKKFRQEAEALSRIHHSGVVDVLDTGELPDGRPYIVMQYIEGDTLRSQLPAEGMNLTRAASILRQIGDALEYVHEKGIFHRDLKPENILLKRGTDSVVLVDFGIAKVKNSVIAPSTANGASVGTLIYMSPEQLRGEEITAASDIYSMGLIAYEMVTGRRPFNPVSAPQLLEMQGAGVRVKPVHLRENLSAKAQTIILRALSFEPRARYERAKEFGDHLARALMYSRVAPKDKQWPKLIGASLVILVGLALLSFGIYKYLGTTGSGPTRSFTYFLTVQKMRDGQPYQGPFKSNGDETFENGDRFRVTVFSPIPGYLYIFHEGPSERNDSRFTMIYPNQATSTGSASLGANQPVQSDWITFRGPEGAENFWIVWSTAPVSELESASSAAYTHPDRGLTGQTMVTVKQYLTAKESEIDATTYRYKASQTAVVRGKSEMLVTLAQFSHR